MTSRQKTLIIVAATVIILLLILLLYLISRKNGEVTEIDFDLPDLGSELSGDETVEELISDPGLWEQVPELLTTEEEAQ